MAEDKKKRYTVIIELSTGSVHKCKVYDTPKKLTEVLGMIDKAWQDKDKDGYVLFGGHYFRISAVVRYALKRRYLW